MINYRGFTIHPCEYPTGQHPGSWVVTGFHRPTGGDLSDELSPHFKRLDEAQFWCDSQADSVLAPGEVWRR